MQYSWQRSDAGTKARISFEDKQTEYGFFRTNNDIMKNMETIMRKTKDKNQIDEKYH